MNRKELTKAHKDVLRTLVINKMFPLTEEQLKKLSKKQIDIAFDMMNTVPRNKIKAEMLKLKRERDSLDNVETAVNKVLSRLDL